VKTIYNSNKTNETLKTNNFFRKTASNNEVLCTTKICAISIRESSEDKLKYPVRRSYSQHQSILVLLGTKIFSVFLAIKLFWPAQPSIC